MESCPAIIKALSYNIHSGKDQFMTPQLDAILSFLEKQQAHILGLQEINENNLRGFQVQSISKKLDMNFAFAPNVRIGNGYYGVATFSPYKIIDHHHILLPSHREQRGMLHTVHQVHQWELHVLNTHLGLSVAERIQQFQVIKDYINRLAPPLLLLGDFNTATPPELSLLDAAMAVNMEHLPTFPERNKRIDYIYYSPDLFVMDYEVIPAPMSDHFPVVAKLCLPSIPN